jgi:hypothetical protein
MENQQQDNGSVVKDIDLSRAGSPRKKFRTKMALLNMFLYLTIATALIYLGSYSYVALIAGFALWVRFIAFILRALNYIDDIYLKSEPSFNEGVELFLVLWVNSVLGNYPKELENTNCEIKTPINYGRLEFCFCWHSWHPFLLGFIELWVYPVFMKYHRLDFIYLYIGLKTVSQFELWKNKRRAFNVFLIGNIIVIYFALHLLRVTENMQLPQSLVSLGNVLNNK